MNLAGHILVLCGGVGGAKLAFGLTRILDPDDLTIVVNTGDDFEHLGLTICPDIDTVVYTLCGLADRERGWGRRAETWNFMSALKVLGGEDWFNLGDSDLAMHVARTQRLAAGDSLSRVTADLAAARNIAHTVAPMSDHRVRTIIETADGDLAFQRYFVQERCQPETLGIRYAGAEAASVSARFEAALSRSDLAAVILCPSNPYLSIDPILALPGVRTALRKMSAPVVAVSPIVGGEALKGPAAKLMRELGVTPSVLAVARHYERILDGLVIDVVDVAAAAELETIGVRPLVTATVMRDDADRSRLASETLAHALSLSRPTQDG
jgi:LPPG:FO 2-phospho-L-lactate transferase